MILRGKVLFSNIIMLQKHFFLFIFLSFAFALKAQNSSIIAIDSSFFCENITPKVSFIPTDIKKIKQIDISTVEKQFAVVAPCNTQAINLGFRFQRILIRFQIKNQQSNLLYLTLSEPLDNRAELMVLDNKADTLKRVHSLGYINGEKKYYTKNATYILPLEQGITQTYYMLADYSVITNLKLNISNSDSLVKENTNDGLLTGGLIGMIVALMLINLFIVLLNSEKALWYNFAFSFGLLVVTLTLSGVLAEYFNYFGNSIKVAIVFGNFAAITSLFFVTNFLGINLKKEKSVAFFDTLFIITHSISGLLVFTPWAKRYAMPILEISALFLVLYYISLALKKYKEKPLPDILMFIIGFLSVFIFAACFVAQFYSILPPSLSSAVAFTVCVVFFTFFLTVACVAKIILARQEKEHLLALERENLEHNVAERTQELNIALEKANESEKKYRLLAENTEDIVAIHDLECKLIYASPSAENYGFNIDNIIGKPLTDFVDQHDVSFLLNLATETIMTQKSSIFEYRLFNAATKSYVWMEGVGNVIFDENKTPNGFLISSRNIQKRKTIEAKIEQYTKELERSNADLESFAHVASHDIKSPLRTVYSFLQLIERKNRNSFDDKDREYFGFIMDSVYQMNMLIDNVLAYAKVGKNIGEPKPIHVSDIEQMVARNLDVIIKEKNATITWHSYPEIIKGHLPTLIQVFQNLVNNAIKYNTSPNPTVEISSFLNEKGERVYSIKDNGIGIEERFQKTIFSMFTRLHQHNEYEGTGVGLALCSRLIDHYGGEIWVESKVGEGSNFLFTLPLTEV